VTTTEDLTPRQITLRDTIAIVSIASVIVGTVVNLYARLAVAEARIETLSQEISKCQRYEDHRSK
jgi:uncharacterized membrane protein (DUF106 family)